MKDKCVRDEQEVFFKKDRMGHGQMEADVSGKVSFTIQLPGGASRH